jgi:hypothetical protein
MLNHLRRMWPANIRLQETADHVPWVLQQINCRENVEGKIISLKRFEKHIKNLRMDKTMLFIDVTWKIKT